MGKRTVLLIGALLLALVPATASVAGDAEQLDIPEPGNMWVDVSSPWEGTAVYRAGANGWPQGTEHDMCVYEYRGGKNITRTNNCRDIVNGSASFPTRTVACTPGESLAMYGEVWGDSGHYDDYDTAICNDSGGCLASQASGINRSGALC